ncbi:MAG: ATP-binding protein [Alphaproteobacteria bacterium]
MSKTKTATPLFLQALGLILATLAATWVFSGVVIFMLPAPVIDVYRVSEVAHAVLTQHSVKAAEGRTIVIKKVHHPVLGEDEGSRATAFKEVLASQLGVAGDAISLATYRAPRWAFRQPTRSTPRGRAGGRTRREGGEPFVFGAFQLSVQQADGSYSLVEPRVALRLDSWQSRTLLIYALAALIVSPLAWLFTRRLTAPIAAFAKAAERLGRDPRAPPLALKGSLEVNEAVEAFNNMQGRLGRYVEDRTAMIGAIAHDLRTPLTRLRFRIESAPEETRAKLAADIDQMDEMISAALAFVRDASQSGGRAKVELSSLVESVVDEAAETGAKATLTESEPVIIDGDSLALRRLLTNLIDNAVKYGGGARASLHSMPGFAVVEIEDDGPGVNAEELERVFEPFYRHEPSRSRVTGGIGLGLAVVRSIARAHGGDVTLHNRPGGGLNARVMLPA